MATAKQHRFNIFFQLFLFTVSGSKFPLILLIQETYVVSKEQFKIRGLL